VPNKLWFDICTVTGALPGSALLSDVLAVTTAPPPGGGNKGAVYTPFCVIVPHTAPVCPLHPTLHTTATELPLAVAVNVCCAPAGKVAEDGLTSIGGVGAAFVGFRVTAADALCVVSCSETAVTVTEKALAMLLGAV
jgi:hypothetical protein